MSWNIPCGKRPNVFVASSTLSEIRSLPVFRLQSQFAQAFGKINSECFLIHCTCSFLGAHLPVQHPHIDHGCVNQVIENSKLGYKWIEHCKSLWCLNFPQNSNSEPETLAKLDEISDAEL
jgi:hypothetical protein